MPTPARSERREFAGEGLHDSRADGLWRFGPESQAAEAHVHRVQHLVVAQQDPRERSVRHGETGALVRAKSPRCRGLVILLVSCNA